MALDSRFPEELAPTILDLVVKKAVGDHASPRPGQLTLARNVASAMASRGHTVDKAPTGVGKSLVALSCAAAFAVLSGERTVIATGSLGLLSQYLEKDAPKLVETVREHLGVDLAVAELKGRNNYVDLARLEKACTAALGHVARIESSERAAEVAAELAELTSPPSALVSLTAARFGSPSAKVVLELMVWACEQYADPEAPGDRQSCPVEHNDFEWSIIAGSNPAKIAGRLLSKAEAAREACAEADIVVTNHTILAIQAAKGLPLVIDGGIGVIHHLVIDEAHSLPREIRQRGAVELSAASLERLSKLCSDVVSSKDAAQLRRQVEFTGDAVNHALRPWHGKTLQDGDDPLAGVSDAVAKLLDDFQEALESADETEASGPLQLCEALREALEMLSRSGRSTARWVTEPDGERPASAHATPVDVGRLMERRLYKRQLEKGSTDEPCGAGFLDDDAEKTHVSVAAMSATIGQGFLFDTNSRASEVVEHATPFAATNAEVALYLPGGPELVDCLSSPGYNGRPKFDLRLHAPWARDEALKLIRANDGRALVLCATSRDGKTMAEHLERELQGTGIRVFSQWDGQTVPRIAAKWRDDERSVLVGTKSLMTGIDAPGQTCSLVIIDRPPRAPKNPVDEARVDRLVDRGMDRWTADTLVYVADASLEMDQAAGRLVRSVECRGLVAALDPRLLGKSAISYKDNTRNTYVGPLRRFGKKLWRSEDAVAFLEAEHQKR